VGDYRAAVLTLSGVVTSGGVGVVIFIFGDAARAPAPTLATIAIVRTRDTDTIALGNMAALLLVTSSVSPGR
jgi:hypothetical protein